MRVSGDAMFMGLVPVTLTGGCVRNLEGTKSVG